MCPAIISAIHAKCRARVYRTYCTAITFFIKYNWLFSVWEMTRFHRVALPSFDCKIIIYRWLTVKRHEYARARTSSPRSFVHVETTLRTKVTKSNYARHLQVFWNLRAPLGGVNQFSHPPLLSTFRCALTRPLSLYLNSPSRDSQDSFRMNMHGKFGRGGEEKERAKKDSDRKRKEGRRGGGARSGGGLALLQTL